MTQKDKILAHVLHLLETRTEIAKKDIVLQFPRQEKLVSYTLSDALKKGIILKTGSTRGAKYVQAQARQKGDQIFKTYWHGKQSESDIFLELQDVFLKKYDLNESARHIAVYAFTEMVNNAFDHSRSDAVEITMAVEHGIFSFTVRDRGIGVFRSVMEGRGLRTERDGLAELTKGKVTTAPKWHSGEGIFFTSRAADVFRLTSGRLTMERKNGTRLETKVLENEELLQGTMVEFRVGAHTRRSLSKDVFGQFESGEDEHDFGKTVIEVGLFQRGDIHVSRSQAKRLMEGLEKFKVVVLDFKAVPLIGQGFADEIFRVWRREHPGTELIVKNSVPDVQFMIDRVGRE